MMSRALAFVLFTFVAIPGAAFAQPATSGVEMTAPSEGITVSLPALDRAGTSNAVRMLLLFTVLSIAPAILISMTSFTRIVVVLSFVRQALGTQSAPPTQVLLTLALMLTAVVMTPVAVRLDAEALKPYTAEQIDEGVALDRAEGIIREFLLRQTREDSLVMFYELSHEEPPVDQSEVSLRLLVPAFMISELRTAFEMGFLLFLPFVLVDLVCGSVLTAMGMVMMPPTMVSVPIKLLLFVLVDGWTLLTRALVGSFG